jgi:lysophospholipase L1-like esterase
LSIRRITFVLLVALAGAVTAMAAAHVGNNPAASSAVGGQESRVVVADPPSVLFVGDSFTAGTGVQNEVDAYPALVARGARWNVHVDAQGATGFIADGKGTGNGDTSRLIDRLAEDGRQFPVVDLLIIDAGRNDLGYPTEEIAAAMSEYLAKARRQWPEAKIVQILPAFLMSRPYDTYPDLLGRINSSLAAVDGTLIDPFAEGWYTDVNVDSLVVSDKVHPNWLGSAHIADRLLASLRDKGIVPAT